MLNPFDFFSTCRIAPENVGIVTAFGGGFLIGGIVSLLTGVTYWRRKIHRNEEPFAFWLNVAILLGLGGMMLLGVMVCRRG